MQFDWPTPEQMIYRLVRLRRLVVLSVVIPVVAILAASVIDPVFLSPMRATLAALAVAMLVAGHVVIFPNVPMETLSLALAVAVMAGIAPWLKSLSMLAPVEHANAALILLIALSVVAMGGVMLVFQFFLGALMLAGPVMRLRLSGAVEVPCSPNVARSQFALQPQTRRGRILTGPEDQNGFFDVAILAPQMCDPEKPTQPMIIRVAAKIIEQSEVHQQTMLVLPNGAVTVTSEEFHKTPDGCRVAMTEMPGDFTLGMHAMFWLTDQQMDNMVETADQITGEPTRVNGLAHGISLLSVAGAILSPSQPVADRAD